MGRGSSILDVFYFQQLEGGWIGLAKFETDNFSVFQ